LLQNLADQSAGRREVERKALLAALQTALQSLLRAGQRVWIFGSLIEQARFSDTSDIDLALERRPSSFSDYWLQGELELRLGRRVDLVLFAESRVQGKIQREGQLWIL